MLKFTSSKTLLLLVFSSLAVVNSSCIVPTLSGTEQPEAMQVSTVPDPAAQPASTIAPRPTASPLSPQPDPFHRAIAKASSAFTLSQSAQSRDDWRLVASRWQQAITLMSSVPPASPTHAQVQTKVREYQRNLAYAQQQANRPTETVSSRPATVQPISAPIQTIPNEQATAVRPQALESGVFYAPIIRRAGGTPVIQVTFNGSQRFDMIVDTGASGTLITRQMAASLGVVPIGQVRVDTASARDVAFPLGQVQSIEVGGAVARDVVVAVAGSDLNLGLLGHDFFGQYDVTIRENAVEFRERR